MVMVVQSESFERFSVSCMQDFLLGDQFFIFLWSKKNLEGVLKNIRGLQTFTFFLFCVR